MKADQTVNPLHQPERGGGRSGTAAAERESQAIQSGIEIRGKCSERNGHEANARGQMYQRGPERGSGSGWPAETAARPQGSDDQHPEQHHRIQQVDDDDRRWQIELHDHRSQQHLNDQEDHRRKSW